LAFAADFTERQAKGHAILAHIPSQCCPAAAAEFRLLDRWYFCYAPAHLQVWEGAMAFCSACGQEIGTASFCPKCGASQGAATAPAAAVAAASPTAGLQENVAGLLCYVLGWISGIIFLLIDKRPWVKFHAAQSIVVFGGLTILRIGLSIMTGMTGGFVGFGLWAAVSMLLGLVGLILWILLMVKAYQHQDFRVPVAAGIADGIAGK